MTWRTGTLVRFCLAVSVVVLAARWVRANPWIDMGPKDALALTQPMVTVEVFEQLPGGGRGDSLGPGGGDLGFLFQDFFLDTGSTSIIAINGAVEVLEENGYVTINTVEEQGIAGTTEMDVSTEYYLEFTDVDSTLALPNTRIMSGQIPALATVNGIVGMPGMEGKVVTFDTGRWEELAELDPFDPDDLDRILELSSLGLNIGELLPAGTGHRYSAPLRGRVFPVIGEEPLPVEAAIPFIDVTIGNGNLDATGQFIFDTGASVSFISTEMGQAIGLDSNDDGVLNNDDDQYFDSFPVGGIGGSIDAPMFVIDRFAVPTEQGVDLVWNLEQSITVLIVDIHPEIDGVLGAEVFTSGWFDLSEEEGEGLSGLGPLQFTHLDFRQLHDDDDPGKVYFDLTPSFDVVETGLKGDYNADGFVNSSDYIVWRNSLGTTGTGLPADGNHNGSIDSDDYTVWKSNYGRGIVAGIEGDYNSDGFVDSRDYTVWRNSLGTMGSNLPADGNGNGEIDSGDFTVWKSNYGESGGAGAGNASAAAPEPSALALLCSGAILALRRRRHPLAV